MKRNPISLAEKDRSSSGIRQCHLLSSLNDLQFDEVMSKMQVLELAEGEILFSRRQAAREIFWVESGQIKLMVSSMDGMEKIIDLVSPGHTFAEAILFDKQASYPVEASAIGASRVWSIDGLHYTGILHNSIDTCFAIMAQLSRRLHSHIAEIDRLSLHNATYRVVSYLLDQVPSTDRGASEVHLDIPKHIIASRLSITPETLSRTFSKLFQLDYIQIVDANILLKDLEGLKQYIHWEGR